MDIVDDKLFDIHRREESKGSDENDEN